VFEVVLGVDERLQQVGTDVGTVSHGDVVAEAELLEFGFLWGWYEQGFSKRGPDFRWRALPVDVADLRGCEDPTGMHGGAGKVVAQEADGIRGELDLHTIIVASRPRVRKMIGP
jgi:hypothetical protein